MPPGGHRSWALMGGEDGPGARQGDRAVEEHSTNRRDAMRVLTAVVIVLVSTAAFAAGGINVSYTVAGKVFEGYYISPADDVPLIFLVHDWDGLTDYEIKRASMLAELGYAVFCADLFGKGVRPTKKQEKKQLTRGLYADRKRMRTLLGAALAAAKAKGANLENAVAIGYCFGGTVVLELARTGREMKGFVIFHGGLDIPEEQDYSQTKGEILVLHGSADGVSTMDDFAELAEALEEEEVKHEMITYGGAPHAFTVYDSPGYHEEADKKSWSRFVRFLGATFRQ